MDISFVTTGLNLGGAETQVVALATALKERQWSVEIISLLDGNMFEATLAKAGIPVRNLGMVRGRVSPSDLIGFAKFLRNSRPLVLHSHMIAANLLARIGRLLCRIPVQISTAHSLIEGGRLREWAYRLTDCLCTVTTQVSSLGADRYVAIRAVPAAKIKVVSNGISTQVFSLSSEMRATARLAIRPLTAGFMWVSVGRFDPVKAHTTLISAFRAVLNRHPDAILALVGAGGKGSTEEECRELTRKLGIEASVQFFGIRRDIPVIMNAADGHVSASLWEGLPLALLEAAAAKLPQVATKVGGVGEIVQQGKNGFLTNPGNVDGLSEAMLSIMEMPQETRDRMGLFGQRYVQERFSIGNVVSRWERMYCALLKSRRLRCPLCA